MTPIWFVEYIAVSAGILVVMVLIIEGLATLETEEYRDHMTEPEDGYQRIYHKVMICMGILLLTAAGIGACMLVGI